MVKLKKSKRSVHSKGATAPVGGSKVVPKLHPIHKGICGDTTHSTVVCISLETRSVTKQVSVAVGWVKIKISLMAQLKGLTAKFKLM